MANPLIYRAGRRVRETRSRQGETPGPKLRETAGRGLAGAGGPPPGPPAGAGGARAGLALETPTPHPAPSPNRKPARSAEKSHNHTQEAPR
ncbi:hypothetical protein [Microcystis phage MJing1]|nr:hypothetical protein [Microcystis phage MJing1]